MKQALLPFIKSLLTSCFSPKIPSDSEQLNTKSQNQFPNQNDESHMIKTSEKHYEYNNIEVEGNFQKSIENSTIYGNQHTISNTYSNEYNKNVDQEDVSYHFYSVNINNVYGSPRPPMATHLLEIKEKIELSQTNNLDQISNSTRDVSAVLSNSDNSETYPMMDDAITLSGNSDEAASVLINTN